jgi:TetR/AcrR family transcriptional regulator, repressor of fatR-cypB operon
LNNDSFPGGWILKDGEKREAIVQAALKLIAVHGFHGAPMSMIADMAGVGTGTIYSYFENKRALISAVYRDVENEIMDTVRASYPISLPFRERFLYLSTVVLKYLIRNPVPCLFLEQFLSSPYGISVRKRLLGTAGEFDFFRMFFQEGISGGELKELPVPVHIALVFGPVISLCRDHIMGFVSLDDSLIVKSAEACWDAIQQNQTGQKQIVSKQELISA